MAPPTPVEPKTNTTTQTDATPNERAPKEISPRDLAGIQWYANMIEAESIVALDNRSENAYRDILKILGPCLHALIIFNRQKRNEVANSTEFPCPYPQHLEDGMCVN